MNDTLHLGDRSEAVRILQKRLNLNGASLVVDGLYGDSTESAVRTYQIGANLVADGIAGPKTLISLSGGDCHHLLKNTDLVNAAQRLGVSLASVYAVNEVESRGQGFLSNGKPVILFERHILHRLLATPAHAVDNLYELQRQANRLATLHPAIINPKPGGYFGGTAEYQRLGAACLIDKDKALESTSWGAFQIMGFHWRRLGFEDVQAFVTAMYRSETLQFDAFVRFIETDDALFKALKAQKWSEFARRYNGPDYQRNLYDAKLQRAYARHALCEVPA